MGKAKKDMKSPSKEQPLKGVPAVVQVTEGRMSLKAADDAMIPITLPWMDKLRERLTIPKYRLNIVVQDFIEPIMRYGMHEEQYITEEFQKRREESDARLDMLRKDDTLRMEP